MCTTVQVAALLYLHCTPGIRYVYNSTSSSIAIFHACRVSGEDLHDVPVLVADVKAQDSLDKMCQRAKLVLNCVGPYALYGEPVVRACIENKTHHIDISGEPVVNKAGIHIIVC